MASDDVLDRSLLLLRGALNTQPSPSSVDFTRVENRSTLFGDDESILERTQFTKPVGKIRKSDVRNLSISLGPDELSNLYDATETRTVMFPEPSCLHQRFQETLHMYGASQVFETISNFIEICSVYVETMMNCRDLSKTGSDLSWLMSECNTWRLVHGLYRDRVLHQDDDDNGMGGMLGDLIHPLSEKDLAENLYNNESSVRECQLIIDWLEKISGDEWNLMSRRPDVGHFTDRTVGWENTLHQLQNSVVPYMSTRSIVSSLDPDAPLRENRPLHDLDVEDEERLLDQVFFEIRCGRLSRAQELCVHCGQAWRGAVLEGWRLHHDPNYRTQEEGTPTQKLPVEGNPNRDVWKLCAWRLCEEPNAHPRDKSILGALCGHLGALLPACSGWEDLLWAYLRAAVDRRVEREIRDNAIRQYVPMPNKYWDLTLNVEGIFREIRANELAKHEAKKPERVIQELLALDLVPDLLERMSEWVETTNCQPQFVRFLAHLVIILRLVGRSQPQELGDNVLRAYIKILVDEGEPNLVAYYVAMMPDDDQIDLYATFLESVTDSEKRIECLRAAEKYELNIKRITQKVVQNIRNRRTELEDTDETLARKASDEDFSKISALDWVVFYPQQRGEAIWQANALVRTFIGQGKLEAARLAFDKIPADSIEMLMTQFKCKVDEKKKVDVNLPPRISSAVKEYLCHKAYLDAQDGFSDWFHHFHNTKPTPPPEPKNKDDFAEKVAHEHKLKMFNEELERWKVIMKHQTKSVKSQLYNIIVFPDGGWLVDENNEDEGRSNQLRSLRSICIPEIVMLLHKVLHSVEEYDECIDLAPLIMDETPGLYKVFDRQQAKDLLMKIAESSKCLMEAGEDPFGNFGTEEEEEENQVVEDEGVVTVKPSTSST